MALPGQLEARLSAALAAERAKVEADERAADKPASWLSSAWTAIAGTETAVSALRTSAHSGRVLYEGHVARAERVRDSADLDALAALLRDLGDEAAIPSVVQATAGSLTATGGVAIIAKDTARDAGALALAGLRVSPYLLVIGAGLAALYYWPRRRPT